MLQQLPKPSIIAHRGSSTHAPENTIAAFELAVAQNADGIELDVKLCADGQIIVIHDPIVDRTSNGSGKVLDLSFAVFRGFVGSGLSLGAFPQAGNIGPVLENHPGANYEGENDERL